MSGTRRRHELGYPSLAESIRAEAGMDKQLNNMKNHVRALTDEMRCVHLAFDLVQRTRNSPWPFPAHFP